MRNYSYEEVRALVENYDGLAHLKGKRWLFPRLVDLEVAVKRLTDKQREVVVLYGMIGLSQDEVGEILGIAQQQVSRRYLRALVSLTKTINGV